MADRFKACSVYECNGNAHSDARGVKGFCYKHYKRFIRHGYPTAGRTSKGEPEAFYKGVVLQYEGDDCLIWPYNRNSAGYGYMKRAGKYGVVSRFACADVNGPPPTPEHESAHNCGNGHSGCVNPTHLEWKTPAANNADRLLHDTHMRGERHPLAKITEDQARKIISLKGKEIQTITAERYGVSKSLISALQTGKLRPWLQE